MSKTQTQKETGYNGWPNYETWCFALWWDNEEPLYRERCKVARGFWADAEDDLKQFCDRSQTARINFADWLKDWTEENLPDLGASLWADLLGAALSEVDYHEVADNWLSEIEGYQRRD
jgi:hypothetical protein